MTRVVIFTDLPGWHGARLREALEARGCMVAFTSLRDCGMRLVTGRPQLQLPCFGGQLPDCAFVRGVAGGSLEEVVLRLNVLHALSLQGVLVYNDGRAVERSVDKSYTSFHLATAGLPTPHTLVCSQRAQAEAFVGDELAQGHQVVSKPLFGSQGEGLQLLSTVADLPPADSVNGVWYLQRYIQGDGEMAEDWRLLVAGGKVLGAMRRTSSHWLTNVAQGGQCQAALPGPALCALAVRAVKHLDMAYAGVDLLRDRAGRWWLLEVNSIPAWRGLQSVLQRDIAAALADDLLARVSASRHQEAS